MNDEILDWLIDKVEKFTKYNNRLTGDQKHLNTIRIEYYSELAQARLDELKEKQK